MVFGPNARRRPDTLRIVVRLAMEAILPLPGPPIPNWRCNESEVRQAMTCSSDNTTPEEAQMMTAISTIASVLLPTS